MKYLTSLLVICLGAACAQRKEPPQKVITSVPGTSVPAKRMASVRTPEVVKAYSAGRYTDPNYPDEMHEGHTVYRREQAPDWNYLPDPPVDLRRGPGVSQARPSQSYYAKTEGELNAQQQAYADALQEQNRAMKKRIESLQQEAGKVPELQREVDQLKKRVEDEPKPSTTPTSPVTSADDVFSSVEPELPRWDSLDEQTADDLLAQMRRNDEYATQLADAERQKISSILNRPFLPTVSLALLKRQSP